MRYLILLLLTAALSFPAIAGASTSASRNSSGGTRWALFSGKHAKKAKKAPKAKRSKKASKHHRAKASR